MGKPFLLHAGHPGLELVNTLDLRFTDSPIELLPSYAELLRFSTELNLLTSGQARTLGLDVGESEAQRVLSRTIELREALSSLIYGRRDGMDIQDPQARIAERFFHEAASQRKLEASGPQWRWTWSGAEHDAQFPLWRLAHEAEDVLLSHEAEQIKECGDPACRWLFLDTSKNHTRRWCNMKTCGNRMKARRFQAKSGQRAVN
jgi:predicted RNA-binding Zn ribbon-like protein